MQGGSLSDDKHRCHRQVYRAISRWDRLRRLRSSSVSSDAGRSSFTSVAGALLVGLLGNALFGAWWLDPAVGLLIAAVAVKEGGEAWRGEGCCVADPLSGAAEPGCRDDCCDG